MENLNGWAANAAQKLDYEQKDITDRKERVMAGPVADALKEFCRQSDVFAKAVVNGGSFHACMKEVAKGVGNHISDIDAYRAAALFYFPEAKVEMTMTIQTDTGEGKKPSTGVVLDLMQFLK